MRLAKQHLDVGLFTNRLEPMLEFWQQEVGLAFEEVLPTGGGGHQHRHTLGGGVLKINHIRDPLPEAPPSGYRKLFIASPSFDRSQDLTDPDGNELSLLPVKEGNASMAAMQVVVRSIDAARRYYGDVLGWTETARNTFECGDTQLFLREDPTAASLPEAMRAPGYRYLTVQVWDADEEYNGIVSRGGTGAMAPRTMGAVARFGFVRDPDGNWLEISQRASLTGPLPENR